MIIQKIDRDWRVYELSLEELEMILNHASSYNQDNTETDDCRQDGATHGCWRTLILPISTTTTAT
jgi:hypothetical protein